MDVRITKMIPEAMRLDGRTNFNVEGVTRVRTVMLSLWHIPSEPLLWFQGLGVHSSGMRTGKWVEHSPCREYAIQRLQPILVSEDMRSVESRSVCIFTAS